jgi:hypothetical protein
MPGGGSPANKALPDSGASPHPETIAITQGQLPHRTESPPIAPNAEYFTPVTTVADCDDDIHIVQFWTACPQRSSLRGDAANSAGAPASPRFAPWPPERHTGPTMR